MIYKLYFTYSPDYQASWWMSNKRLYLNRMWKEVVIQADNKESALSIAQKYAGEHSFSSIEKLEPVEK